MRAWSARPTRRAATIVKAYVVLRPGQQTDDGARRRLQDHVKAEIAPYKYPRAISFVDALPRTESGKVQRFVLRERAKAEAEKGACDVSAPKKPIVVPAIIPEDEAEPEKPQPTRLAAAERLCQRHDRARAGRAHGRRRRLGRDGAISRGLRARRRGAASTTSAPSSPKAERSRAISCASPGM